MLIYVRLAESGPTRSRLAAGESGSTRLSALLNKFNGTPHQPDMTTTPRQTETTNALTPRERYRKVLSVVEYNSGGPDVQLPAGAALHTVLQIAWQYGRHDFRALRSAVDAAIANEDLLVWRDRDGTARLTRTNESSLRDLVAEENRREDTSLELVERCSELVDGPDVSGGEIR